MVGTSCREELTGTPHGFLNCYFVILVRWEGANKEQRRCGLPRAYLSLAYARDASVDRCGTYLTVLFCDGLQRWVTDWVRRPVHLHIRRTATCISVNTPVYSLVRYTHAPSGVCAVTATPLCCWYPTNQSLTLYG